MDWTSIILAILGVFTCGGYAWWINLKAAKKKPELENRVTESTITETTTNNLDKYSSILSTELERNAQLATTIDELRATISDLKSDLAQCQMAMCRVSLCPFREPEKGMGDDWFAQCKADHKPIFDNSNFEDFLKNKGYVVKRITKKED